MKRLMLVLTVALFLIGLTACGGGKYADVESVLGKMMDIQGKFAAACENMGSADDAVKAIDAFTADIKDLTPKMKELLINHPELKEKGNEPEELKPLMEKMEESNKKMSEAMQKMAAYQQDPKVQEAQMKLFSALTAMATEKEEK